MKSRTERSTADRISNALLSTAGTLRSAWRDGLIRPRERLKQQIAREAANVSMADGPTATVLRAGQSGGRLVAVMLTITIAAAVGFVGTKVISEIDKSIKTTSGTKFDNASDSIAQGFADAMQLTDVVFLVLIAGVVLAALLGFQRMRR